MSIIGSIQAPLVVHFCLPLLPSGRVPPGQSTSVTHSVRHERSRPQTMGHTPEEAPPSLSAPPSEDMQSFVQSLFMTQPAATSGARHTLPLSLLMHSWLLLQSLEDEHCCTQNPSAHTRFPVHSLFRTHVGVGLTPDDPPQPWSTPAVKARTKTETRAKLLVRIRFDLPRVDIRGAAPFVSWVAGAPQLGSRPARPWPRKITPRAGRRFGRPAP